MFKPAKIVGSAILSYLGKFIRSPDLLARAVDLDPINLRAKLYLLQQKQIPRDSYYKVLFETFETVKFVENGLQQHAQHQAAIFAAWPHARAELYQDLFVLSEHRFKRGGFFVEVGVGNGKDISNTYLLENDFGWRGILAEPNQQLLPSIKANRQAAVDQRAVFSKSGLELDFLVDQTQVELSTLVDFKDKDRHAREGKTFKVSTVTLNDLLDQHAAPREIDYISIDTEGSELEIVQAFDFSKYRVSVFTVEHNYDHKKLAGIQSLMRANNFTQAAAGISKWDAWFVSNSLRSGRAGGNS